MGPRSLSTEEDIFVNLKSLGLEMGGEQKALDSREGRGIHWQELEAETDIRSQGKDDRTTRCGKDITARRDQNEHR